MKKCRFLQSQQSKNGLRKKMKKIKIVAMIAVAGRHSLKSCGIALAEVLPSTCGIAIADLKKSCACPPVGYRKN
jgi:hypothetical protein